MVSFFDDISGQIFDLNEVVTLSKTLDDEVPLPFQLPEQ